MDKKIIQIPNDEVMQNIVNGETVYRMNLNNTKLCDLTSKSVTNILNELEKDGYIYFAVKG